MLERDSETNLPAIRHPPQAVSNPSSIVGALGHDV